MSLNDKDARDVDRTPGSTHELADDVIEFVKVVIAVTVTIIAIRVSRWGRNLEQEHPRLHDAVNIAAWLLAVYVFTRLLGLMEGSLAWVIP